MGHPHQPLAVKPSGCGIVCVGLFCPFIRFLYSVSEQGTLKCHMFNVLLKHDVLCVPWLGGENVCFEQKVSAALSYLHTCD